MTATLGDPRFHGSAPDLGRHRAPDGATTGSMGVVPAERRSREAHAPGRRPARDARPAGLGPDGPVPTPMSRAARTAGLSLAALGALAGAGGVATANLAHTDEPATTGEFALPTNLVSADMSLASPAHQALDVAAPAVMPALARTASASPQASPAIKTSSPASRAAAAEKSANAAKAAKAAADAREAKAASSSIGAKAVALAKGQIGVPYEWGGTTPSGFDCSGLMQWAYEKLGKDLPRTSAAQATEGKKVSMDDLQPGDLVFMYSPVSHVGMYAGNGQIVEAPTEGEDVKMTPISKYEDKIVSARRL